MTKSQALLSTKGQALLMKKSLTAFISILLFFFSSSKVYAVCPACTIAVGAGLGLSRFLGIDDTISGVWVGGLILSTSLWLISWLEKKNFKIFSKLNKKLLSYLTIIFIYSLVLIPFWPAGIIGHPVNTILGIDKLLFGTLVGSVFFLLGFWADKKVRQIKGRQLFAFQKVAFPVVSLLIISLVIFFYGGYLY